MKVAHLWFVAPIYGGAETWAIGLSKALRKKGVQSDIVCWRTEGPLLEENIFKVLGGNVSSSPDVIDSLMYGAFMARQLRDYDLVCAHHIDVQFPAVFSKSLYGCQVASILHEPPMAWKLSNEGQVSYRTVSEKSQEVHTIWKMFLPYSDFHFTNSVWNQKLHEKYEGLSPIPLLGGVDHDLYKPDSRSRREYREKLKINEDTTVLFYSSAAGRRKKHEILLRALRDLVSRGENVKCILTCSKDRLTQSFHPLVGRIIEELRLEDNVLAFPATSREVLLGLYNACDIYVHPANNEHLGMAIMEAMAVGKPVVAQRNGGVPEIVEDSVDGFLFKTESIEDLVTCLAKLMEDKDLARSMGVNALRRSWSFDWTDVAKKFLDVTS